MFDSGGHFFSPVMGVIGIQKILNDCSLFEPLCLHQGIIYAIHCTACSRNTTIRQVIVADVQYYIQLNSYVLTKSL